MSGELGKESECSNRMQENWKSKMHVEWNRQNGK